MKVYHNITKTILNVNLEESNIKSEQDLKTYICKNMDSICPDNIKFIKNAKQVTGKEVLAYESIQFIIVPITCYIHNDI